MVDLCPFAEFFDPIFNMFVEIPSVFFLLGCGDEFEMTSTSLLISSISILY